LKNVLSLENSHGKIWILKPPWKLISFENFLRQMSWDGNGCFENFKDDENPTSRYSFDKLIFDRSNKVYDIDKIFKYPMVGT
jgi:hypothetical protein